MIDADYAYRFDDIVDEASRVKIWRRNHTGAQVVQLLMDDGHLRRLSSTRLPTIIADAIDLATTVHVADRLSLQRTPRRLCIHIELPVRHPEVMGSAPIVDLLADILSWYTDRQWSFDFRPRRSAGRPTELQYRLPHASMPPATEVALWSGGLDAAAGLIARSLADSDATESVTLFGTGSNAMVQRVQRAVADHAGPLVSGQLKLIQLPIRLTGLDRLPTNGRPRARGFIFLLLGAACAVAEGQARLAIYENGIGAINLPFCPASIGLALARSVHPRSLLQMGLLVSRLLDSPFRYENPFLFWTKAQICAALGPAGATTLVPITVTCDRRHRRRPFQCGYCSSCLLRRQALAAAGILDRTIYRLHASDRRRQPSDADHLLAMLDQVAALDDSLRQPDPWTGLAMQFVPLSDVVDWLVTHGGEDAARVEQRLVALYQSYVREWAVAREIIGPELLSSSHVPTAV